MLDLNIKLKYKDGKIVPLLSKDKTRLDLFKGVLQEGTVLDVYFSIVDGNEKTNAQLRKVHAMIKDLAKQTGIGFNDMKLEIKRRAGLYQTINDEMSFKSFADCSKEELASAIEECMEIDNFVNNPY